MIRSTDQPGPLRRLVEERSLIRKVPLDSARPEREMIETLLLLGCKIVAFQQLDHPLPSERESTDEGFAQFMLHVFDENVRSRRPSLNASRPSAVRYRCRSTRP